MNRPPIIIATMGAVAILAMFVCNTYFPTAPSEYQKAVDARQVKVDLFVMKNHTARVSVVTGPDLTQWRITWKDSSGVPHFCTAIVSKQVTDYPGEDWPDVAGWGME